MYLFLTETSVFMKSILQRLALIENKIDKINTQQELLMKNVITPGVLVELPANMQLPLKTLEELTNLEEQLSDNDNMQSLVSISYYFGIMPTKKFS